MKTNVCIPVAIQLCFDDVGWHEGTDMRYEGRAPRSGIPRHHEPEDYEVLAELGRGIGQKILAPLVLGDWDKDNFLRGAVGFTHDPAGWDRASEIDYEKTEKCFDILDGSDYIEYAIHGLLHSVYTPSGELITAKEYFDVVEENGEKRLVLDGEETFNKRLDIFYKIYKSWGFRKEIRTFVSPCGMKFANDEMVTDLERRLSERGIKFHTNYTFHFDDPLRVYSGVTLMKKGCSYLKPGGILEWNVYDFDPSEFVSFVSPENFNGTNIIGLHWTNLLRYQPKRNMERLPDWIAYFKRESETFGTMISKDIGFSANQQFYNLFAKIDVTDGKCYVDLAAVKRRKPEHLKDEFYISFRRGTTPKNVLGGKLSLYEEHAEFITYKVEHSSDRVILEL